MPDRDKLTWRAEDAPYRDTIYMRRECRVSREGKMKNVRRERAVFAF